jgi:hypothetical protein
VEYPKKDASPRLVNNPLRLASSADYLVGQEP